VIWRVRGRREFAAFARAARRSAGPLAVAVACDDPLTPATPPRVAFAVGRGVGPAVERNLVRRRLRAAVQALESLLAPGCAYLVVARPAARELTYSELSAALRACLVMPGAG
jgi:ribonuclease P protein component